MNKSFLEILAIFSSVALIVGWTVFWVVQVIAVIEFLELANG